MQDFVLKIHTQKSGSRDPRTLAAEGERLVRTHPRAHLPDVGAPPLILGWLYGPDKVRVIVPPAMIAGFLPRHWLYE